MFVWEQMYDLFASKVLVKMKGAPAESKTAEFNEHRENAKIWIMRVVQIAHSFKTNP